MRSFTASTLPPELSRQLAAPRAPRVILPVDEHTGLHSLLIEDAAELYAVVDANRLHLRAWLPWVDATQSPTGLLTFIESSLSQAADGAGFHAAIRLDGRIVGIIGHHRIDWPNRTGTLGYWLAENAQGRGIMTAACRVVVDHAFAIFGLNRVQIRCATGNRRSRAIPERLGFTCEGVHREAEWLYDRFVDHAIYARLAAER